MEWIEHFLWFAELESCQITACQPSFKNTVTFGIDVTSDVTLVGDVVFAGHVADSQWSFACYLEKLTSLVLAFLIVPYIKHFNLEHFIRLLWHNGPNTNKIRYMKTHDRDEACKCFGGESATRFATWGSNARHVTSRCKLNAAGDCFTQCHTWSLFPTIITSYLRIGFAQYLGSMLFTARSVNKRKFIPTIPNSFKSMSRTIKIKVKVKGKGISL